MLTKEQALKEFKEHVLPGIRSKYEQDGRVDHTARREDWNNFTDYLREDKRISNWAYENWTNPF